MIRYLLDTNVLIAVMRGNAVVMQRMRACAPNARCTSSLVYFELWYGVSRSVESRSNTERLRRTLAGVEVLALDQEDARVAGEIRAQLQRMKQPIGPYDTLIAAQALARGMVLITANEREFRRVAGLQVENWATPL